MKNQSDWIRDAVIHRVESLKLNPRQISLACIGRVSDDQIRKYLAKKSSMSSEKLQHILLHIGLEISKKT